MEASLYTGPPPVSPSQWSPFSTPGSSNPSLVPDSKMALLCNAVNGCLDAATELFAWANTPGAGLGSVPGPNDGRNIIGGVGGHDAASLLMIPHSSSGTSLGNSSFAASTSTPQLLGAANAVGETGGKQRKEPSSTHTAGAGGNKPATGFTSSSGGAGTPIAQNTPEFPATQVRGGVQFALPHQVKMHQQRKPSSLAAEQKELEPLLRRAEALRSFLKHEVTEQSAEYAIELVQRLTGLLRVRLTTLTAQLQHSAARSAQSVALKSKMTKRESSLDGEEKSATTVLDNSGQQPSLLESISTFPLGGNATATTSPALSESDLVEQISIQLSCDSLGALSILCVLATLTIVPASVRLPQIYTMMKLLAPNCDSYCHGQLLDHLIYLLLTSSCQSSLSAAEKGAGGGGGGVPEGPDGELVLQQRRRSGQLGHRRTISSGSSGGGGGDFALGRTASGHSDGEGGDRDSPGESWSPTVSGSNLETLMGSGGNAGGSGAGAADGFVEAMTPEDEDLLSVEAVESMLQMVVEWIAPTGFGGSNFDGTLNWSMSQTNFPSPNKWTSSRDTTTTTSPSTNLNAGGGNQPVSNQSGLGRPGRSFGSLEDLHRMGSGAHDVATSSFSGSFQPGAKGQKPASGQGTTHSTPLQTAAPSQKRNYLIYAGLCIIRTLATSAPTLLLRQGTAGLDFFLEAVYYQLMTQQDREVRVMASLAFGALAYVSESHFSSTAAGSNSKSPTPSSHHADPSSLDRFNAHESRGPASSPSAAGHSGNQSSPASTNPTILMQLFNIALRRLNSFHNECTNYHQQLQKAQASSTTTPTTAAASAGKGGAPGDAGSKQQASHATPATTALPPSPNWNKPAILGALSTVNQMFAAKVGELAEHYTIATDSVLWALSEATCPPTPEVVRTLLNLILSLWRFNQESLQKSLGGIVERLQRLAHLYLAQIREDPSSPSSGSPSQGAKSAGAQSTPSSASPSQSPKQQPSTPAAATPGGPQHRQGNNAAQMHTKSIEDPEAELRRENLSAIFDLFAIFATQSASGFNSKYCQFLLQHIWTDLVRDAEIVRGPTSQTKSGKASSPPQQPPGETSIATSQSVKQNLSQPLWTSALCILASSPTLDLPTVQVLHSMLPLLLEVIEGDASGQWAYGGTVAAAGASILTPLDTIARQKPSFADCLSSFASSLAGARQIIQARLSEFLLSPRPTGLGPSQAVPRGSAVACEPNAPIIKALALFGCGAGYEAQVLCWVTEALKKFPSPGISVVVLRDLVEIGISALATLEASLAKTSSQSATAASGTSRSAFSGTSVINLHTSGSLGNTASKPGSNYSSQTPTLLQQQQPRGKGVPSIVRGERDLDPNTRRIVQNYVTQVLLAAFPMFRGAENHNSIRQNATLSSPLNGRVAKTSPLPAQASTGVSPVTSTPTGAAITGGEEIPSSLQESLASSLLLSSLCYHEHHFISKFIGHPDTIRKLATIVELDWDSRDQVALELLAVASHHQPSLTTPHLRQVMVLTLQKFAAVSMSADTAVMLPKVLRTLTVLLKHTRPGFCGPYVSAILRLLQCNTTEETNTSATRTTTSNGSASTTSTTNLSTASFLQRWPNHLMSLLTYLTQHVVSSGPREQISYCQFLDSMIATVELPSAAPLNVLNCLVTLQNVLRVMELPNKLLCRIEEVAVRKLRWATRSSGREASKLQRECARLLGILGAPFVDRVNSEKQWRLHGAGAKPSVLAGVGADTGAAGGIGGALAGQEDLQKEGAGAGGGGVAYGGSSTSGNKYPKIGLKLTTYHAEVALFTILQRLSKGVAGVQYLQASLQGILSFHRSYTTSYLSLAAQQAREGQPIPPAIGSLKRRNAAFIRSVVAVILPLLSRIVRLACPTPTENSASGSGDGRGTQAAADNRSRSTIGLTALHLHQEEAVVVLEFLQQILYSLREHVGQYLPQVTDVMLSLLKECHTIVLAATPALLTWDLKANSTSTSVTIQKGQAKQEESNVEALLEGGKPSSVVESLFSTSAVNLVVGTLKVWAALLRCFGVELTQLEASILNVTKSALTLVTQAPIPTQPHLKELSTSLCSLIGALARRGQNAVSVPAVQQLAYIAELSTVSTACREEAVSQLGLSALHLLRAHRGFGVGQAASSGGGSSAIHRGGSQPRLGVSSPPPTATGGGPQQAFLSSGVNPLYLCTVYLRAVLLRANPQRWEELENGESSGSTVPSVAAPTRGGGGGAAGNNTANVTATRAYTQQSQILRSLPSPELRALGFLQELFRMLAQSIAVSVSRTIPRPSSTSTNPSTMSYTPSNAALAEGLLQELRPPNIPAGLALILGSVSLTDLLINLGVNITAEEAQDNAAAGLNVDDALTSGGGAMQTTLLMGAANGAGVGGLGSGQTTARGLSVNALGLALSRSYLGRRGERQDNPLSVLWKPVQDEGLAAWRNWAQQLCVACLLNAQCAELRVCASAAQLSVELSEELLPVAFASWYATTVDQSHVQLEVGQRLEALMTSERPAMHQKILKLFLRVLYFFQYDASLAKADRRDNLRWKPNPYAGQPPSPLTPGGTLQSQPQQPGLANAVTQVLVPAAALRPPPIYRTFSSAMFTTAAERCSSKAAEIYFAEQEVVEALRDYCRTQPKLFLTVIDGRQQVIPAVAEAARGERETDLSLIRLVRKRLVRLVQAYASSECYDSAEGVLHLLDWTAAQEQMRLHEAPAQSGRDAVTPTSTPSPQLSSSLVSPGSGKGGGVTFPAALYSSGTSTAARIAANPFASTGTGEHHCLTAEVCESMMMWEQAYRLHEQEAHTLKKSLSGLQGEANKAQVRQQLGACYLGMVRCLRESDKTLACAEHCSTFLNMDKQNLSVSVRREIADIGCRSLWLLGEWSMMEKCLQQLRETTYSASNPSLASSSQQHSVSATGSTIAPPPRTTNSPTMNEPPAPIHFPTPQGGGGRGESSPQGSPQGPQSNFTSESTLASYRATISFYEAIFAIRMKDYRAARMKLSECWGMVAQRAIPEVLSSVTSEWQHLAELEEQLEVLDTRTASVREAALKTESFVALWKRRQRLGDGDSVNELRTSLAIYALSSTVATATQDAWLRLSSLARKNGCTEASKSARQYLMKLLLPHPLYRNARNLPSLSIAEQLTHQNLYPKLTIALLEDAAAEGKYADASRLLSVVLSRKLGAQLGKTGGASAGGGASGSPVTPDGFMLSMEGGNYAPATPSNQSVDSAEGIASHNPLEPPTAVSTLAPQGTPATPQPVIMTSSSNFLSGSEVARYFRKLAKWQHLLLLQPAPSDDSPTSPAGGRNVFITIQAASPLTPPHAHRHDNNAPASAFSDVKEPRVGGVSSRDADSVISALRYATVCWEPENSKNWMLWASFHFDRVIQLVTRNGALPLMSASNPTAANLLTVKGEVLRSIIGSLHCSVRGFSQVVLKGFESFAGHGTTDSSSGTKSVSSFDVDSASAGVLPGTVRNDTQRARLAMLNLTNILLNFGDVCSLHSTFLKLIDEQFPSSLWIPVIPLLISRIAVPQVGIRALLLRIMNRVIEDFPHYILFHLVATLKQSRPIATPTIGRGLAGADSGVNSGKKKIDAAAVRLEFVQQVLQHGRSKNAQLKSIIDDYVQFAEGLTDVSVLLMERWIFGVDNAKVEWSKTKSRARVLALLINLHEELADAASNVSDEHAVSFAMKYGPSVQAARSSALALQRTIENQDYETWSRFDACWQLHHSLVAQLRNVECKNLQQFDVRRINPRLAGKKNISVVVPGTLPQHHVAMSMAARYPVARNSTASLSLSGLVTVAEVDPTVYILPSAQRPKRIHFLGSNGEFYRFLLKGREDLKQDDRIMQLLRHVNGLLECVSFTSPSFGLSPKVNLTNANRSSGDSSQQGRKSSSSSSSASQSKTATAGGKPVSSSSVGGLKKPYRVRSTPLRAHDLSVTPLSECAGLIGWVDDAETMGNLVRDYRKTHDTGVGSEKNLVEPLCGEYDKLTVMQKIDVHSLVSMNTDCSDLSRMMQLSCHSLEHWMSAQRTFTDTLAVMSIVGYALGLGDRHPSNIMIRNSDKAVVHIDYGDSFEVAEIRQKLPEKVPFRASRMIVRALDLSGVYGPFRTTCLTTLEALRTNRLGLLSLLSTFVYDPVTNWKLCEEVDRIPKSEPTARKSPSPTTATEKTAEPEEVPASPSNVAVDEETKTAFYARAALERVATKLSGTDYAQTATAFYKVLTLPSELTQPSPAAEKKIPIGKRGCPMVSVRCDHPQPEKCRLCRGGGVILSSRNGSQKRTLTDLPPWAAVERAVAVLQRWYRGTLKGKVRQNAVLRTLTARNRGEGGSNFNNEGATPTSTVSLASSVPSTSSGAVGVANHSQPTTKPLTTGDMSEDPDGELALTPQASPLLGNKGGHAPTDLNPSMLGTSPQLERTQTNPELLLSGIAPGSPPPTFMQYRKWHRWNPIPLLTTPQETKQPSMPESRAEGADGVSTPAAEDAAAAGLANVPTITTTTDTGSPMVALHRSETEQYIQTPVLAPTTPAAVVASKQGTTTPKVVAPPPLPKIAPMTVQQQADWLIARAVSTENIAQAYTGWMPFW